MSNKKSSLPKKNRDMSATVGLVLEVRDELKAEIRGLEHRQNAKFEAIEARFESIDSRFKSIDARFERVEAKLEEVLASVHRTQAIVEEQRGENRIMLGALHGFVQRMDQMEARQDKQEETLRILASKRDLS